MSVIQKWGGVAFNEDGSNITLTGFDLNGPGSPTDVGRAAALEVAARIILSCIPTPKMGSGNTIEFSEAAND